MPSADPAAELYDPFFHTPHDDVYEIYAALRTHHPVYYNAQRKVWCLTRHADVQAAARDWRTFGTAPGVDIDSPNYMGPGNFIDADPPRHDVLRSVVRPYFLPKSVAAFAGEISQRVESILAELRERETVDLAHDFAWRLPIWAISRLLGTPEEDDDLVQRILLDVFVRHPGKVDVPERADTALSELQAYLSDLVEHKRRHPDERVLSRMVAGEADGAPRREETVGMATMFFIAGSETTFALIGNALRLLAEHRDALAALRRDPSPQTIEAVVEEVIRFDSPVQYLARTLRATTLLHDTELQEGDRLILIWAAANRDPECWTEPDRFDIGRPLQRHVGFGEGIHFCIGAPLARLEASIALPAFVRAFPEYEVGERRRLNSHIVRGWQQLEARLGRAA